jgi:hypothetical protein
MGQALTWSHFPHVGSHRPQLTPENARLRPELFLHDACLPEDLKPAKATGSRMTLIERIVTARARETQTEQVS